MNLNEHIWVHIYTEGAIKNERNALATYENQPLTTKKRLGNIRHASFVKKKEISFTHVLRNPDS